MSVLVVAPHPDDESLGCGGTICTHVAAGDRVVVLFLTSGERAPNPSPPEEVRRIREEEAAAAMKTLGVAVHFFLRGPDGELALDPEAVGAVVRQFVAAERPDVIYVPHEAENHGDHIAAFYAVRHAVSDAEAPPGVVRPSVLAYEVSTPLTSFDRLVDITEHMANKMRAIRTYRSQLAILPYDVAVEGLNAYRGALFGGCAYAEAFISC